MKSFKQFMAELRTTFEWFTFEVDEFFLHILFESSSQSVLTEAKYKGLPLGGQYSAQLHRAHSEVGSKHIHVYAKNNQLFALNIDGTAHDASHRTQIPNKLAVAIQGKFPDFILPPDNFIESAPEEVQRAVESQFLID